MEERTQAARQNAHKKTPQKRPTPPVFMTHRCTRPARMASARREAARAPRRRAGPRPAQQPRNHRRERGQTCRQKNQRNPGSTSQFFFLCFFFLLLLIGLYLALGGCNAEVVGLSRRPHQSRFANTKTRLDPQTKKPKNPLLVANFEMCGGGDGGGDGGGGGGGGGVGRGVTGLRVYPPPPSKPPPTHPPTPAKSGET